MADSAVKSITIYPLVIPMRRTVSHAASQRAVADPVVVAVELNSHVVGYGETLARPYVTGETTDTVIDAIQTLFSQHLLNLHPPSFPEALEAVEALPCRDAMGTAVPAARAAVELALTRLAGQLASEWPVLLLPAVIWGVVIAWRRDRALAVAVLGAMGLNLAAGLGYHRDPAGVDVFFLLLLSCACVLMGVGLDDVDRRLRRHLRPAATAPIILACGVTVFIANLSDADRSGADLPDAYGRQLLEELPEDAILLTDGDDASYIVDYLHRVEGVRPDVTIYNRMGRGTDLGSGAELLSQRARLRRRREASLLESGRAVHFLAARKMAAAGF
ncbi:MAG: hypothetical protein IID39_05490, partial [Planctomycetes bacterium]|nr:hypothetical protein [Planctomycetota bacterium]